MGRSGRGTRRRPPLGEVEEEEEEEWHLVEYLVALAGGLVELGYAGGGGGRRPLGGELLLLRHHLHTRVRLGL